MKHKKEKELIKFLENKYPIDSACEWDHVGYSLKQKENHLKKILVCLDVNKNSINWAIKNKVSIIISFHPFKFGRTWKEIYKYDPFKMDQVKILKQNKISVYSLHTNFESAYHQNIYGFIDKIKSLKIKKMDNFFVILKFNNYFDNLVEEIKNKFKFDVLLSNVSKNFKINNLIFFPGAGDIYEFLKIRKKWKIDLIVTSDIKWNEQQLLNSESIKFLIIPHNIENVFVDQITKTIKYGFDKNVEIIKYKEKNFLKGY